MIEIKSLSYYYPGNHKIFEDLSFSVESGEFWGILGKNGAGKTTLMKLLLGEMWPRSGSLLVSGDNPLTCPHLHVHLQLHSL